MHRADSPFHLAGPNLDTWTKDGKCSYCGSLSPEVVLQRIEAGEVEVGPTDKNYKAYIRVLRGDAFKQTHRTDDKPFKGWDSPEHTWVTQETKEGKFYYQHFSEEQCKKFVELYNAHQMHVGYPGHFYRPPFFMKLLPVNVEDATGG